jgi:plasmid stability protein
MAQILLRGLDDALVARLKGRARQNHHSLQGEVRAILEEMAPLATPAEIVTIGEKWQGRWKKNRGKPSATAQRSSAR